jgi:hypothetical protein
MFEKTFQEMMAVDVKPYVKQRDGADYLPWAACKKLLHDSGAEVVMFWPVPGPDGSTLRKSDTEFTDKNGVSNRVYEVLVHIQVDGIEWDTAYPVLNGNNPVKDNSMSQLRVHNAIRRAFVKGVAERTGLGFSLWLDVDDLPDEVDDLSKHNIFKVKQRFQELVTAKINDGIPLNVIADRLGMDDDTFRSKFALYNELARLEKSVWDMKP